MTEPGPNPDELDETLLAETGLDPDLVPEPPVPQSHHRDVQGGVARASVFGANDGLVTNVSLILLVAGASTNATVVRLAGFASLVAGAVSMAFGEWVSMKAQSELMERELELERRQLEKQPHVETVELAQIYMSRGIEPDTALKMASELMADPERALETHAREELGITPQSLGSPVGAAIGSFFAFAVGAVIPLIPWFFGTGTAAIMTSLGIGMVASAGLGIALGTFTGKSKIVLAFRHAAVVLVASLISYGIGSALGVETV